MARIADLINLNDGFKMADYPTILSWYQDRYREIYGADVNLAADTQDGEWLAVQAQAVFDLAQLMSAVYNSLSPSTAGLDALRRNVKINGLTPQGSRHSQVGVVVTGDGRAVNVVGMQVSDANSRHTWLLDDFHIPLGQTSVHVRAVCQDEGPVEFALGEEFKIITPIRGVTKVVSDMNFIIGRDAETSAELRARQARSTMLSSKTTLEGIMANIKDLGPQVVAVKGYDNDTNAIDVNGIPAHTVAFVVKGGNDDEVAMTIARGKTDGVPTFGTIERQVTLHGVYGDVIKHIRFSRPDDIAVAVEVDITARAGWVEAYADDIKKAVAAVLDKSEIGQSVFRGKLYAPALLLDKNYADTYTLNTIKIGRAGSTLAEQDVTMGYAELAHAGTVTVTVHAAPR